MKVLFLKFLVNGTRSFEFLFKLFTLFTNKMDFFSEVLRNVLFNTSFVGYGYGKQFCSKIMLNN